MYASELRVCSYSHRFSVWFHRPTPSSTQMCVSPFPILHNAVSLPQLLLSWRYYHWVVMITLRALANTKMNCPGKYVISCRCQHVILVSWLSLPSRRHETLLYSRECMMKHTRPFYFVHRGAPPLLLWIPILMYEVNQWRDPTEGKDRTCARGIDLDVNIFPDTKIDTVQLISKLKTTGENTEPICLLFTVMTYDIEIKWIQIIHVWNISSVVCSLVRVFQIIVLFISILTGAMVLLSSSHD